MKKLLTIFAAFAIFVSSALAQSLEFNAKTIENKNVTQTVFEDAELTMVNIWGTFCGPCINEMPDLGKLNSSYKEGQFQVVGIVIDAVNRKGIAVPKTVESAKKIVETTKADYLHIVPDTKLLSGVLRSVTVVPTTLFVNKKGEIIGNAYTGSRSFADWKKIVDELLANEKSN